MNNSKILLTLMTTVIFSFQVSTEAGITPGGGSSLAIYSGTTNDGWISAESANANADLIMTDPRIVELFGKITNFEDGDVKGEESALATWAKTNTGNGRPDVIITACGTMPSALYPFPNLMPDGSVGELFVEAGNILINVADWIGYMSYEDGDRSPDNGPDGAANMFDIEGLSFGSRSGNIQPNANGKKYIPSMTDFKSDRPWHTEQFEGSDWDLVLFGEDGDDADPAVAISKTAGTDGNGMIAALFQAAQPTWPQDPDPRGIGVVEFIANWLANEAKLKTAVESEGKLAITWANVKK